MSRLPETQTIFILKLCSTTHLVFVPRPRLKKSLDLLKKSEKHGTCRLLWESECWMGMLELASSVLFHMNEVCCLGLSAQTHQTWTKKTRQTPVERQLEDLADPVRYSDSSTWCNTRECRIDSTWNRRTLCKKMTSASQLGTPFPLA